MPSRPDLSRLVIWVPVAFGLGIAGYFSLAFEPGRAFIWALWAMGAISLGVGLVFHRHERVLFFSTLGVMACLGFQHIHNRTQGLTPPSLEISDRAVTVSGWIEAIERTHSRPRFRINVLSLEGFEEPPKRIRVLTAYQGFEPGDTITLRAVLSRPSGPSAPGGYDPARAAWFDGIAFTGYAIRAPEAGPDYDGARFVRALAQFRWRLAEYVRSVGDQQTAGLAAALLTGDRSGVAPEDRQALQQSGLGHILAISGLHMALFAGGVYWLFRWVFAAMDRLARHLDPRKPAALIALVSASGYLLLSGAATPTQRAWIMAVVVLLGVLADRRAFSMRSLAIAAAIILTVRPESVIEVGFQMSFAAVAALISAYELVTRWRGVPHVRAGLIRQMQEGVFSLSMTSLIAGAATGAFAAFHFQRMASYGLLANLLAMPVFTFWVMPVGVIALALTPTGLSHIALGVMEPGLQIILQIAHWTSSLEGARFETVAPSGAVIALYGFGFAALTLGYGLMRLLGGVLCLTGLAAWALQSPPDLMITDNGVVIAQFGTGEVYQASTLRSRFDTQVMIQRAGGGVERPERATLSCDTLGCVGQTRSGTRIAITDNPESLIEDCARTHIVVFKGEASAWRHRRCQALLLDDIKRAEIGGAQMWIENGQIYRFEGAELHRGQRPWNQPSL